MKGDLFWAPHSSKWCATDEEALAQLETCFFCGDWVVQEDSKGVLDWRCETCSQDPTINAFGPPGFEDFWHEVNMGAFEVIPVD